MFAYLFFTLVLVKGIESNVDRRYPLTADGPQIDFDVNNKDTVLRKVQGNVNEQDKIVRLTRSQPQAPSIIAATSKPTKLPNLENRFGISVGLCPTGYVQKGTFCFLDDDYEDR